MPNLFMYACPVTRILDDFVQIYTVIYFYFLTMAVLRAMFRDFYRYI